MSVLLRIIVWIQPGDDFDLLLTIPVLLDGWVGSKRLNVEVELKRIEPTRYLWTFAKFTRLLDVKSGLVEGSGRHAHRPVTMDPLTARTPGSV